MSYSAREQSAQDGRPVYLYKFVQGVQQWLYTNAPVTIVFAGESYAPSSVGHSEVKQSNELAKDSISLTFPLDDPFASQFLGYAPDLVTSVTLLRGHIGDGEFVTYWKGRVASSKATGAQVRLECESIFTSLRRPGLRARYQRTCRHALYGRGCTLDPEVFAVTGRVSSMTSTTLTVPEAGTYPDGHFTGGMVRAPDNSLRLVSNHVGQILTLSRPSASLSASFALSGYGYGYGLFYGQLTVLLYPGCDRLKSTCKDKFNNLDNYGGFPYIPLKNPFGGSSIV